MKKSKKFLALCLAVAMFATLALSGCGSSSASSSETATTATATEAPTADTAAPAAETEAPAAETTANVRDDLVVASSVPSVSLLPWDNNTTYDYYVIYNVFEPIMYAEKTFDEIQPRVCDSYEVSEDGCTYTFHMTEGVSFSDGTPVTADDVAGTLMLYAASYMSKDRSYIIDAQADGDNVVVTLSAPCAMAAWDIASCMVVKIADYNADPEAYAQNPIGCGAYVISGSVSGSSTELTANEDYYRGAPSIKKISIEYVSDSTTISLGLQDGSIDYAQVPEAVVPTLEGVDGLKEEFAASDIYFALYINCADEDHPELQNPAVRQAIASAINYDVITGNLLSGVAQFNSTTPVSVNASEYDASNDNGITFNADAAKQMLADAGISTPIDLGTIQTYTSGNNDQILAVLQQNLASVGINVEIEVLDSGEYIGNLMSGGYDLGLIATSFYDSIYYSSIAYSDPVEGNNFAQYVNPELQALYAEGYAEQDAAARQTIANQIQQILADELPTIKLADKRLAIFSNETLNTVLALDNWVQFYDFSWNA